MPGVGFRVRTGSGAAGARVVSGQCASGRGLSRIWSDVPSRTGMCAGRARASNGASWRLPRRGRAELRAQAGASLPSPSRRLAKVELPALIAVVGTDDVMSRGEEWEKLLSAIGKTSSARGSGDKGGISAVVLEQGGDDGATNDLYEAAIAVTAAVEGRGIPLILRGRPDIAVACEASGVLLSQGDIPTVAARRILNDEQALVIREVSTASEAKRCAEEGASALVVSGSAGSLPAADLARIRSTQRGAASIPALSVAPEAATLSDLEGVDGLIGRLSQLEAIYATLQAAPSANSEVFALLEVLFAATREAPGQRQAGGEVGEGVGKDAGATSLMSEVSGALVGLKTLLDARAPRLIDGKEGSASGLLEDALAALDESILLVLVGEFNSGKSSVINGLLGADMLPVGVVPTTNEVSMLKYGREEGVSQREDGVFLRTLNNPFLKQVTVVDTPGTNVIVERQQKLTEDFIPRADMVLFVLSADRPLTESETKFMTYIKRWGKKIVFVVNKKELLSASELQEVCSFIEKNAGETLGVKRPAVFPISAKLASSGGESGFDQLTRLIGESLSGRDGGQQMKFNTALSIGLSLTGALGEQLRVQRAALSSEEEAVRSVSAQVKDFAKEMKRDARVQYSGLERAVDTAVSTTDEMVDSVLSLGNAGGISSYLLGSEAPTVGESAGLEILRSLEAGIKDTVSEYEAWLLENCTNQFEYYSTFLEGKANALAGIGPGFAGAEASSAQAATSTDMGQPFALERGAANTAERLGEVLSSLSPKKLSDDLDQSLREAATTSFGTAVGAIAFTVFLTFVLNSFTEDLLALGLGGAVAYLSVLSIPLQRSKVKFIFRSKVKDLIDSLVAMMKEDLETALADTGGKIDALAEPISASLAEKAAFLEQLDGEQKDMESSLQGLRVKVKSLG